MRGKLWIVLFALWALNVAGISQDDKRQQNRDQDTRAGEPDLPRMPGAMFLFGSAPNDVWLSTFSGDVKLQPSVGEAIAWESPCIEPSVTRDGGVVASMRWKGNRPRRMAIATYSVADKRWTEYAEGNFGNELAISPNGTKLAYIGEGEETNCGYYQMRVHVIDLTTRRETIKPAGRCVHLTLEYLKSIKGLRSSMSFSPEGNRLVLGGDGSITVWDVDANAEWKIGDGERPAWSPNGEWIAYFHYSREQRRTYLRIVHPDGKGAKTVATIPFHQAFFGSPVWSPDSKALLLNWSPEGGPLDTWLLNLETLKRTTKFKDTSEIRAWVEDTNNQQFAVRR